MSAAITKPSMWRSLRVMATAGYRADRRGSLLSVLLALLTSLDIVRLWSIKLLVDGAVNHDTAMAVRAVVLMAFLGMLSRAANNYGFLRRTVLGERTDFYVDQQIMDMTLAVPGLEHHERPDYADELKLLREQRGMLSQVLNAIYFSFETAVQVALLVALLAAVDPRLGLLPLAAVPSALAITYINGRYRAVEKETAPRMRLAAHLFELSTTPGPGKELRIFGIGPTLRSRYQEQWSAIGRSWRSAERRHAVLGSLGWLFFGAAFAAGMLLVVARAADGDATLGDVIATVTLATRLNVWMTSAVDTLHWLLEILRTAGRYVWLQDYSAGALAAQGQATRPAPPALQRGITLEGVTFTYPGTNRTVLDAVDLTLPAGATIAVVGENGAGKSTLMKLLCRFYEPTSGRITVDGVDLREVDLDQWRARTSAGFQDFARFELLAQEAVGVGELEHIEARPAVEAALTRAAASDVVDTLASGLDTQLGRSWTDGAELSGGQWQKVALGRAMMRSDLLLLVLDEPTASLDADAEHRLFERYAAASQAAKATSGAITVLVSHRFSTVRTADLIVVVDEGGIAEVGTHEELVAQGGLYAELYELQARQYR